ncbi:L-type lectin-domain containing receptor kinase IX.1 isoform X1 [Eucalyptus grandis]|uniref:L-type lectin-domain containing receptor kinase IX.1 isoform X1 n=1 Tax=Eucalyptus grandis TaxID=71139 RepID=UPI00192F069E|nr:L-type lectin-domain containing receptor kinase IX.1 isoform X1 [Eucalyptus grandis]XP_018732429.2 L-type lectin-domain containing receptor kinase IX.1 isoform X1 [Eucalyptus grandis]
MIAHDSVRMPRMKEALVQTVFILSLSIPFGNSESFDNISFNFPSFQLNDERITFQGNASVLNSIIQLTIGEPLEEPIYIVGRALYHQPMHLWDSSTGNVADFVSQFTFSINSRMKPLHADGFVFFLAPSGSQIPERSEGGFLGLTGSNPNSTNSSTAFVAVEFDTFYNHSTNPWDPLCYHVGIDVNSLTSVSNTCVSWMNDKILLGQRLHAQVTYNSRAMNLSVVFRDDADNYTSLYYHPINLTKYLPEWVVFGFAATTGQLFEAHTIFSWEFNSSLRTLDKKSKSWVKGDILGLISLVFLILVAGFGWYGYKLTRNGNDHSGEEEDVLTVDEGFEQSKGPKKYSYKVLAVATNNFANSRLLGAGGFGEVYEGHLADAKSHVAIKKITPNSKQGIKEYATEVKTIRHLRHKNLVELIGWCHEKNEFLLMYEFMANGSLDSHLFKDKIPLTWERRYNIAQGIALGLKYLHEDLKHCVVHRDIKSSNILLDAHFEAKLGDFGLARMFDHAKGSQTTVSAGTLGYLAPECIYKGKASKESDIYSFGVVLLEIACGRKAIDLRASEDQVQLVEWVWELYGIGKLLNAADPKLGKNFDTRQIECLMIVGLWCAHPDPKERPPISRAIAFLNFDASPPILPLKLPIPTYIAPPTSTPELSHISSSNFRSSEPSSTYSTEPSAFTSSS